MQIPFITTNKAPGENIAIITDQPPANPSTLLSLPKLPPPTAEVRRLREEGVHVHRVRFDVGVAEQERQATVTGLAGLPSSRARMWYSRACTIDDWYGGTRERNQQAVRDELDHAGDFPRWEDFERETIQRPLTELHAHAGFRVHYQGRRRGRKIVAVRFHLDKMEASRGNEGFAP